MRLIVVLGTLLILSSCSNWDISENFSVSCFKFRVNGDTLWENTDWENTETWTFDFDNNIVTSKPYYDNGKSGFPERYDIIENSSKHIYFGKNTREYTFNRRNLRLTYYKFDYIRTVEIIYWCKLTQV